MLDIRAILLSIIWGAVLMIVMLPANGKDNPGASLAPAFMEDRTDYWINSGPLDWNQLRGKVVLVNVWTYGCINCKRSMPWLKAVYEKYREQGFEIIGVHSPEFDWERPRAAVEKAIELHQIDWPVLLDNRLQYWRQLNNRYWPAFYLVDQEGRIIGHYYGETHSGDRQALRMEKFIEILLSTGP